MLGNVCVDQIERCDLSPRSGAAGRAHSFYVKYSKHFTVDQRRRILADSPKRGATERAALPPEEQADVDLIVMKRRLEGGVSTASGTTSGSTNPIRR